ncbi:MAG: sodium:calcium antiporter [Acidimicrobiia bacterium]
MWLDIVRISVGLVVLVVAADRLVLAAIRIARVYEVSAVVIGAVIVGFGTSIPEFAVSAMASGQGNTELAISNVTASNITNVMLVLGIAAVIVPLSSSRAIIRREGFLMLASVSALGLLVLTGTITRFAGLILVGGLVAAIILLVKWSKDGEGVSADIEDIPASDIRLGVEVIYGSVGLFATVIASQVLLTGVENVGEQVGLSVVFMGLITGVGTSLPELSASIAGARRRQTDLILGNVLGSNTFNSLGVAGVAALIGPGPINEIGLPIVLLMVGSALVVGILAYTWQRISRLEGFLLLVAFVGYVVLST